MPIRAFVAKINCMADISANFLGIKSPNPFWLASAPPTDKKINVLRAFEAGWGGVVWKTLGSQVKNVSSRYSSIDYGIVGWYCVNVIFSYKFRLVKHLNYLPLVFKKIS